MNIWNNFLKLPQLKKKIVNGKKINKKILKLIFNSFPMYRTG